MKKRVFITLIAGLLCIGLSSAADDDRQALVSHIKWLESNSKKPLAIKKYCETHFPAWLSAVQKSYPEAEFLMGICFYSGYGFQKPNQDVGVEWCTKAANKGNLAAMNFLASHYLDADQPDFEAGGAWLKKAADADYSPAMFKLGLRYDYGFGIGKDSAKALVWYRKAAAKGNADAMCSLGICFEFGRGVKESPTTAVSWYRKAAQAGHPEASYRLAIHYSVGKTLDKNLTRAVDWLKKSANGQHVPAMYMLGKSYATGQGIPKDVAMGLDWYRKAAILGNHEAMFSIALHYLSGEGIPKDDRRAVKWLIKAAKAGNPKAKHVLDSLQEKD